ncbi:MAG TPA: glycosyltransferase family 2 protein, partial [Gemmataceae bacterium]|nr:glycosyltransferase family 2 protein [Gemmataceae bacterium]
EARTVGRCIDKALDAFQRLGISGEVIVADNGSTDGSPEIAGAHGAHIVHVQQLGYGRALQGGIEAARGRYLVMGDADDSYDFGQLDAFLERLRAGDDLVVGNRFQGGIRPGAMPWLHRYLGNPLLSGLLNLFFRTPIGDAHCGLRACRKESYQRLGLTTPGMEFASEMVVKAMLQKQKVSEVSIILYPDGRDRPPHLRSFRDGWRHLRFLLLMCPSGLYLFPALLLLSGGLALMAWLTPGPRRLGGVVLDLHSLLLGCLCLVLSYQLLWLWAFARLYSWSSGLMPGSRPAIGWFRYLTLERGLLLGALTVAVGLLLNGGLCVHWWRVDLGRLEIQTTMRYALWSSTLMLIGMQTVYGSFFLSMLQMRKSEGTLPDSSLRTGSEHISLPGARHQNDRPVAEIKAELAREARDALRPRLDSPSADALGSGNGNRGTGPTSG